MLVGECDNIEGELAEAQAMVSELNKERDELSASLSSLEAVHANLTDNHDSLRYHGLQLPMICPTHVRYMHTCAEQKTAGSSTACCSCVYV